MQCRRVCEKFAMCLGGTWCRSCIAFTGNARLIQFIAVHSTWSQCFRVCTIPYSTLQILTAIHLVSDKPFPREQEKLAPTTSKHPLLPSDALMQRRSLSAVPMLTTVDENVCSSHLSMNELRVYLFEDDLVWSFFVRWSDFTYNGFFTGSTIWN